MQPLLNVPIRKRRSLVLMRPKCKPRKLPIIGSLMCSAALVLAIAGFSSDSFAIEPNAAVEANPAEFGSRVELPPRIIVKFVEAEETLSDVSAGINKAGDFSNYLQTPSSTSSRRDLSEFGLTFVEVLADNAGVFEIESLTGALSVESTDLLAISTQISNLPEVEYAEPDLVATIQQSNDPKLGEMWHLTDPKTGVNVAKAWPSVTGMNVRVAVIDTGYRPHADLKGNILPGYDFISVPSVANDGDGRDSDALDPGDWCPQAGSASSWHGTHVAGTVAAIANNSKGVAGVAYDAKIVPIRVLGRCGGYTSDISAGIRWAAGLTVPGTPANPYPAQVINLSLGGVSPRCPRTYQDAIDAAVAAGTTVVVAAGNSGADATGFAPANCRNVITVASTARDGGKAWYTNFGSSVEISGPGGSTRFAKEDGILSTINDGATNPGSDSYGFYQGTSMAAPHVAGIAALIYSRNPRANPANVLARLIETAKPFPRGADDPCNRSRCGAGIADASAAIDMTVSFSTGVENSVSGMGASSNSVVLQSLISPQVVVDGWDGVDSEGGLYPSITLGTEIENILQSFDGTGETIEFAENEDEYRALIELGDLSPWQGDVGPERIIGTDDRNRVLNTTRFPESAQVLVALPNGRCSGAMIGPDLVLTAGHCVHRNGTWQRSARIFPGRNGRLAPFGVCDATRFYSVLGWTRDANPAYDFGAIKLNCDVGQRTGWLGFFWQSASLVGIPARVSSYPGDKPLEQWTHTDRVRSNSALQTRYQTDTMAGNSGSAVFASTGVPSGCGECAHTAHAYGGTTSNAGTRITKPLFENLIRWRSAPRGTVLANRSNVDVK